MSTPFSIYNVECIIYNLLFSFDFFIIVVSSLVISMQSLYKLLNSYSFIKSDAKNNFNQYSVSLDSFNEIPSLFIKSFLVNAL